MSDDFRAPFSSSDSNFRNSLRSSPSVTRARTRSRPSSSKAPINQRKSDLQKDDGSVVIRNKKAESDEKTIPTTKRVSRANLRHAKKDARGPNPVVSRKSARKEQTKSEEAPKPKIRTRSSARVASESPPKEKKIKEFPQQTKATISPNEAKNLKPAKKKEVTFSHQNSPNNEKSRRRSSKREKMDITSSDASLFSDASCSDINSEEIFSDASFSEGSDDEGYRTNPTSAPSKIQEDFQLEEKAPIPQARNLVVASSTDPSPIDTKSMLDKWETKLSKKPEVVTSSTTNNARESLSELQTLETRRKQIEERFSKKDSSPPAEKKPAISLGYSGSLRDKRTALEQTINRSASGRSIRQESLSAEDREEALTRSRSARLMWEKKTQVQRRRADSESDDEVLYTDNTRGQLNDTKRERPPVRNMTLDEDALLDEVNLSESQARAIIEDLDLTVDDVSQEIEQVDRDEELEGVEKDEMEDKSEDIGGHEIIIDESLSEDDPHEDANAYADQLETPDALKSCHESVPSEFDDYEEVKLSTPLNPTMKVPVSLSEDIVDNPESLDKEQEHEFPKEGEDGKETDPESVYLSAQEESISKSDTETENLLTLGEEPGSSKSDAEEESPKRSNSVLVPPDDPVAEPNADNITVSEDEDEFPEPCPDPVSKSVHTSNSSETKTNEITNKPPLPAQNQSENHETNESNNNSVLRRQGKLRRPRAMRAVSQPVFSKADLEMIEKHRNATELRNEQIVEEAITGKNVFANRLSFFNDIVKAPVARDSPKEIQLTEEEDLGLFKRSGSVRDMARKFGSNTSLANSNNSNSKSSAPLRRSASLRIKTSHFNVQRKEIEATDFKRLPRPEKIQLPKKDESEKKEKNHEKEPEKQAQAVIVGKHRKGGFLSRAPPKVTVPEVGNQSTLSPRKSMKLQQLEARYGEKMGSPLPNKISMPTSKSSEPVRNASPNLPQSPQKSMEAPSTPVQLRSTSKKARSDDKGVAKMRRQRPKSAVPDISFSLDVNSPVASRKSFIEKIATSSSNQQDKQLTVSSTVVRNLPQIDTDELDNILHQSVDQKFGVEKSAEYGGAVDIDDFAPDDRKNRAPLLTDQPKRPRRPRSQSRPRSINPMKTVAQGESSYSEQKTDLAMKMCQGDPMKQMATCATSALQATEDVTKIRLRKTQRDGDENSQYSKNPLLIRFKGRRQVAVELISPRAKRLSHHDSFVLVTSERVFTFLPQASNIIEKNHARDFAQLVTKTGQLGTHAKVVEDADDSPDFWKILGSKSKIPTKMETSADESDLNHENACSSHYRCWRLHEVGNKYKLSPEEKAWGMRPEQNLLQETEFFIFEFGSEVYSWIGPKVSFAARRAGEELGKQIWEKFERKKWHIFAKVTAHRETALFTEKFSNWLRADQQNIITPQAVLRKKSVSSKQSSSSGDLDLKEVAFLDLDQELLPMRVKSGRFNVSSGDGEIIDDDGRILNVATIAYSAKTIQNGAVVERNLKENFILKEDDVLLLIWTFSISGTGRWKGSKKAKNKTEDKRGAARQLTFIWSGPKASDHIRGQLALLANELKLGVFVNVSGGLEPEVFMKAWRGRARFVKEDSHNEQVKLFLLGGESETSMYLKEIDSIQPDLLPRQSYIIESLRTAEIQIINPQASPVCPYILQQYEQDGYSISEELIQKLHKPMHRAAVEERIVQMWIVANVNGRFTPMKAECRHLNSHYRFEQLQLKPISILLSTKALYIWREQRESVDNATFYGKLYLAARAIAQRIDDQKNIVDIFAGSEPSNFCLLFPHWSSTSENIETEF